MLRSVLLLVLFALLVRSSVGTFPGYDSDSGLLGKALIARARARFLGEPVPPFESFWSVKPEPVENAEPPPSKVVPETEERRRESNRRKPEEEFIQQEVLENDENEFQNNRPEQQITFEDSDDFRQNSGRISKPNDRKEQFLKPGKHFPEGYPARSDDGRTQSFQIFPTVPGSLEGKNIYRVLDSPLPKPGEMPSYTVFVRSGDPDTDDSPTVHIVKHSVQSVVPVDAKKDQKAILGMHMWAVPESLRNDESVNESFQRSRLRPPMRMQAMRAENPDDVLGAAKRDLYFRMGSLYGVPRDGHGHVGAHGPDAFGHAHIDLIDGRHGGSLDGSIGIDFGHGSSRQGGFGHGGFGHGGLGRGGLGHGGIGRGGIGRGGFGHRGFGNEGFGQSGFEQGAFGHGAFGDKGFGASEHGQHEQNQDSFSHSTFSETSHGSIAHEQDEFGAGAHGHNKFGNTGSGNFEQGFDEFGRRSADAQVHQEGNPHEELLGIILPKQMMLPYMGLLDMSVGGRGYTHFPSQRVSVNPSTSGPVVGHARPVYSQPPPRGPCVAGYC